MNPIVTLLWLEMRKSSWLLIGVALLFVLVIPLLASTPPEVSPASGEWSRSGSGGDEDGKSSYTWSAKGGWQGQFSWITGEVSEEEGAQGEQGEVGEEGEAGEQSASEGEDSQGSPPSSAAAAKATGPPDILQFTVRPRQLVIPWTVGGLTTLLLIGFLVLHYRESESGEIALLYQSPLSGDLQIWTRFGFMLLCVLALHAVAASFYTLLQTLEGHEVLAPIAENASGHVRIDWINVELVGMIAFVGPHAAFVLLFCQVQNAYGLLNRRRLAGVVLFLAFAKIDLMISGWLVTRAEPTAVEVRIANATFTGQPDGITDAINPSRYLNLPVELLGIGLLLTVGMLFVSGRVWKEVEWS